MQNTIAQIDLILAYAFSHSVYGAQMPAFAGMTVGPSQA